MHVNIRKGREPGNEAREGEGLELIYIILGNGLISIEI